MQPINHKPEAILAQDLRAAAHEVAVGELYYHYKHPELLYRVAGLAILEATDEVGVRYQAQYGERIEYVRALRGEEGWLATVQWQGQTVLRFTKAAA